MNAVRILVFVVVMGTVSGGLLVGVNTATSPLIARNEELALKSALLDALEITYEESKVIEIFAEQIQTLKKGQYTFYQSPDGAFAFVFSGSGLWGPVSGIISLENDLKTIRKVKITHQEETPGLGARIAEENYLKQFRTKEVLPKLIFMPEGKARDKNEVDAITGATGSSRALEKLLNENIQRYVAVLESR